MIHLRTGGNVALVMSVWMGGIILVMILTQALNLEILSFLVLLGLILIAENRTPFYVKPVYLIRLYSLIGVGVVIFLLILIERIQGMIG